MKRLCAFVFGLSLVSVAWAEPSRVLIMDFDDQTGMKADDRLGGQIAPSALVSKGAQLLGQQLLGSTNYTLVDRRDYLAQVAKLKSFDDGLPTPVKPTYIHAAQQLNTDAILRGSLMSFSSGKSVVNLGGQRTEFQTLTLRVGLEAMDAVDGSVIAMTDGSATGKFRQTDAQYTELSEDDAVALMQKAISEALPNLKTRIDERRVAAEARPKVRLDIDTTENPAMVEIDGVLVGTTPVKGLSIYKGDHVLAVSKPGYRTITKRVLFESDAQVQVPMLRTELSAAEEKEILEKSNVNIFSGPADMKVIPIIAPVSK